VKAATSVASSFTAVTFGPLAIFCGCREAPTTQWPRELASFAIRDPIMPLAPTSSTFMRPARRLGASNSQASAICAGDSADMPKAIIENIASAAKGERWKRRTAARVIGSPRKRTGWTPLCICRPGIPKSRRPAVARR
jgi:hypothetical protein